MSKKYALWLLVLTGVVALVVAGCRPLRPAPPPNPTAQPFPLLQEALSKIKENYVEREGLDPAGLERGAIAGMVGALKDPYSAYLEPQLYKLELAALEGTFEGIGAHVTKIEEHLVVIAPIPGSPADGAGLRPGTLILEVGGEATTPMSLQQAVLKIRGPRGSQVRLLVVRPGEDKPVEIVITRADVRVESVAGEMRQGMVYIRLSNFTQGTSEEFRRTLSSLLEKGAQGIVLDLRFNPGGLLAQVVEIADELLEDGLVVSEVKTGGEKKEWRSSPGGLATHLPLAALVNTFSASGSEVLAGAIQDRGRGAVIGTKTFGKGSVNAIFPLSDSSALYLTIARWLTPKGNLIEGKGVTPDLMVEITPQDVAAGKDPQLERALEYLKQQRTASGEKA